MIDKEILEWIKNIPSDTPFEIQTHFDIHAVITGDFTFYPSESHGVDVKNIAERLLRENCEAILQGKQPSSAYMNWFAMVGLAYLRGDIKDIATGLKLSGKRGRPGFTSEQIQKIRDGYADAWSDGYPMFVLPAGCLAQEGGSILIPEGSNAAEFSALSAKLTREDPEQQARHRHGLALAYKALHGLMPEEAIKGRAAAGDFPASPGISKKELRDRMQRIKTVLKKHGNVWLD